MFFLALIAYFVGWLWGWSSQVSLWMPAHLHALKHWLGTQYYIYELRDWGAIFGAARGSEYAAPGTMMGAAVASAVALARARFFTTAATATVAQAISVGSPS